MKKLQMLVLTFAAIFGMVQPLLAQDTVESLQSQVDGVDQRLKNAQGKLDNARQSMDEAEKQWHKSQVPDQEDALYKAYQEARKVVSGWEDKIRDLNQEKQTLMTKISVAEAEGRLNKRIDAFVNRPNDVDGQENPDGSENPPATADSDNVIDMLVISGGQFKVDNAQDFRKFMSDPVPSNLNGRNYLVKVELPFGEVRSYLVTANSMQLLARALDELNEANAQKDQITPEEYVRRLNEVNEKFEELKNNNELFKSFPGYPKTGLASLIEQKQLDIRRQLTLIGMFRRQGRELEQQANRQAQEESLRAQRDAVLNDAANQILRQKIQSLKQELQGLVNQGDASGARTLLEEFIQRYKLDENSANNLRQELQEMWQNRQTNGQNQGGGYNQPQFPPQGQPQQGCQTPPPSHQQWCQRQQAPPPVQQQAPVQAGAFRIELVMNAEARANYDWEINPDWNWRNGFQNGWHNIQPNTTYSFWILQVPKGGRSVDGQVFSPNPMVIVKIIVRDQFGREIEFSPTIDGNGHFVVTPAKLQAVFSR